jgi:hypothetical protein
VIPPEYQLSSTKAHNLAGLYVDTIEDIDAYIWKSERRFQRNLDVLRGFLKKSGLFKK